MLSKLISCIKLIVILMFFSFILSSDSSSAATVAPTRSKLIFLPKVENPESEKKINYSTFKGLDMDKDIIQIIFEGKNLNLVLPVYTKENRYFLPFTELIDKVGGKYRKDCDTKIELYGGSVVVDTVNNTFTKSGKGYKLKKNVYVSGEIVYLSLFDITRIMDLKTVWDYKNKSISLFFNRDKITQRNAVSSDKYALVRIEDIVASTLYRYGSSEALEKLRIMSDYLYSGSIPFHIAWIPRYIDSRPETKDDNDLSSMYSFYNCDFVYTMDYMISRGAIAGLHGYTHQSGNSASVDGVEFGISKIEQYVKDRLNMAVDSSKKLDIPFSFFEAPHYQISQSDLSIVEMYFDYVYQRYPGIYSRVTKIKRGGRTIKYVPTPLDYLDGKGQLDNMLSKINGLGSGSLASFFYHPNIEFDDIKITSDSTGYHNYEYSGMSALHQLVKAIEDKGFKFISIYDLQ